MPVAPSSSQPHRDHGWTWDSRVDARAICPRHGGWGVLWGDGAKEGRPQRLRLQGEGVAKEAGPLPPNTQ